MTKPSYGIWKNRSKAADKNLCESETDADARQAEEVFYCAKYIQMLSLPFSYCADIVPFILSTSVLEIASPSPVDFLAAVTV